MTAIHRREMLRVMLGGAVVLAMLPVAAESAQLAMSKSLPAPTENLVEEAVVVVRRRRRRVCWWHRGIASAAGAKSKGPSTRTPGIAIRMR
jgi:hypothetical protein